MSAVGLAVDCTVRMVAVVRMTTNLSERADLDREFIIVAFDACDLLSHGVVEAVELLIKVHNALTE